MAEEDTFASAQQNVEGILAEIDSANHSLRDIIAYCTTNYELQRPEVFEQAKTYLEDAMTNAAYQIFRGASEVTNLIDMQNFELLGMQASIQCLTTSDTILRDGKVSTSLKSPHARSAFHEAQTEVEISPEPPLESFVWQAGAIDLSALNAVGTPLAL